MNAHQLAQRMNDEAAMLAAYLLPKGRKVGAEWKAGSIGGEEGQSLSVRIHGVKRGLWRDFATDEGGDLLDLWAACRGLSIAQACIEAKAYLGIRDAQPERAPRQYRRPQKPPCQAPKSRVREWLQGRGISEQTIADFRIGEQLRDGKAYAVFPYLRDGVLVNCKYRSIDDKHDMRQESGAEPCLFGWHLIGPKAREIAITEGELDAMTLHQCGIPALSINAGAGNHNWIEQDWDRLDRFSDILVCFDDDDAGHKGAAQVVNRLGIERCKIVRFGAKDANEWLMQGASGEDFASAVKEAKPLDPDELKAASEFMDGVKALFWSAQSDLCDPILRLDRDFDWFQFRRSELSVWTGYNGHGKSLLLSQVLIGLMDQGERVMVFSGEMAPVHQLKRMVKQCSGIDRPTPKYIDAIGDWLGELMWLFNLVGSASIDRLIEVFGYASRRYGVGHCVIDSLMMTDVPEDGPGSMSAQKAAMQKLCNLAKRSGLHVHLVAHPRKGRDESGVPGKLDVAGSSKITDGADNVWTVWSAGKEESQPITEAPDGCLELHKQRNGDVQHKKLPLWFVRASQQFVTNTRRQSFAYVRMQAQEQPA